MSRDTVSSLKGQLATANSNADYWKRLYESQCQATRTANTEANNLRTQRNTAEQTASQLRQSISDLHDHYQKTLDAQDQTHADVLEACAQLAGQALKSQAEKAQNAIERVVVEDSLVMAELKGQRDALDRAFKYLADRD